MHLNGGRAQTPEWASFRQAYRALFAPAETRARIESILLGQRGLERLLELTGAAPTEAAETADTAESSETSSELSEAAVGAEASGETDA